MYPPSGRHKDEVLWRINSIVKFVIRRSSEPNLLQVGVEEVRDRSNVNCGYPLGAIVRDKGI